LRDSHILSAPDRIRTCDLRFRRPTLYPTELRARVPNLARAILRARVMIGCATLAHRPGVLPALAQEGDRPLRRSVVVEADRHPSRLRRGPAVALGLAPLDQRALLIRRQGNVEGRGRVQVSQLATTDQEAGGPKRPSAVLSPSQELTSWAKLSPTFAPMSPI
jgi:hypothetical protein